MLPHKNVRTLVEAMDEPALSDAELLLAGPLGRRQRVLFDKWRNATGARDRITHREFVTIDELADLYAGASVVALPSLYEGFGLPLLEAMHCGAPAVASSIPAHREVGGDAAIYVEQPREAAQWARTLAAVMRDPNLSESLSQKGRNRAKGITWESIAEQMVALARMVAQGGSA
jgi:glycosyltransferase involved in cell wall biosynthesis